MMVFLKAPLFLLLVATAVSGFSTSSEELLLVVSKAAQEFTFEGPNNVVEIEARDERISPDYIKQKRTDSTTSAISWIANNSPNGNVRKLEFSYDANHLEKHEIPNPKIYDDVLRHEVLLHYLSLPEFPDMQSNPIESNPGQHFTTLNILFTLEYEGWKTAFPATPNIHCNATNEKIEQKCVAEVEGAQNVLLGFVSMKMKKKPFSPSTTTEDSKSFLRIFVNKLFDQVPEPIKVPSQPPAQVRYRSFLSARSTNTTATDTFGLQNIWDKASLLRWNLYSISPYWYTYNYDDSTYPIDSIIDGGNDMFDRGNQIKFYEDNAEPTEYLQYNNASTFENFDVIAGGSFFPFMTLAWIRNDKGQSHTYTMKVSGNLGTDGEGLMEQFDGKLTIQPSVTVEYHVFQVYGTDDPPICEVYFTVTNQAWNSVAGDAFVANFSDQTDDVTNSVSLTGKPQNVLMGYALLSVMNTTKVQQNEMAEIFSKLVEVLEEDEEDFSGSCGGTYILSNETGAVTIGSPSLNSYDSYLYCTYAIQATFGSKIEVILLYGGWNSYLSIRDSSIGSSHGISGSSQQVIWTSQSDTISLIYQRYSYPFYSTLFGLTEFSAQIREFVPTCGFSGRLNSTETTLASPGFLNGYFGMSDCVWVFTDIWNSLHSININDLQLSEEDDFLVINSGDTLHHFYKEDASAHEFYVGGSNSITIHYHAVAHAANDGFSATINQVFCDETYNMTDTASRSVKLLLLSSTGYFWKECSHTFYPQAGYNVEVTVKFERNFSAGYYNSFRIEVEEGGSSYSRYFYSSINETTIASNENYLQISHRIYTYLSENVTLTYRQFQANCGFNFSSSTSGIIKSTSFPNENTDADECFWIIHHPSGNPLQFEIDAFTLPVGSGYLEVTDDFSRIEKYEKSLTVPTKLFAASGILRIRYHAAANSGALGFNGTYSEGNCDQTILISDYSKASISLEQNRNNDYYYRSIQCTTTISAQPNHLVELMVQFEGNQNYYRSIKIINGNTDTWISGYQGNQRLFISRNSTIQIQYDYFVYDYGFGSTSFQLIYKQVQPNCGQNISSRPFSQSLNSSNYPDNYNNNEECYWTIQAGTDRSTKLRIHDLTVHSNHDHLDIVTDENKLVRYDVTINDPVDFVSNRDEDMIVRFVTDSSGVQKGFNATYQEVICGRTFPLTNPVDNYYYYGSTSTSIPNFPYQFWANNNENLHFSCDYSFTAEEGNKVNMQVNPYYGYSCCWYLEVFDGNTKIGYHDHNAISTSYISSERSMKIVYHNNGTVGGSSNYFGSRAYAYASQFAPECGHVRTADTTRQTITSPGYPSIYKNNVKCLWVINVPDQQVLRFTIDFLDLADGDSLEINDGGKKQNLYSGLISIPRSLIFDSSSVRIQFLSDSYNSRKGFTATYVLDQSPCSSEPCQNDGTCLVDDDTFRCLCPERFSGSMCEKFVSPCDENPCLNGGTCVDTSTGSLFECLCVEGFAGNLCFGEVNECFPNNPCAEYANCTDAEQGYNCTCMDGYRGDGNEKCYKIIILPYGIDVGDTLLDVSDDAASERLWIDYEVAMGSRSFSTFRVTSNGLITLGWSFYFRGALHHPPANGFADHIALIAPFWDDFHPDPSNDGRVYYQMYDKTKQSLDSDGITLFNEVAKRIENKFNTDDFTPLFILKATWHNVVMYPGDNVQHQQFPSTFQAILTSDGCDTYLLYLYKEGDMRWETGLRSSDEVLIGFTNGADWSYKESQGNYRPDQRVQKTNGLNKGEYIYKLTESKTEAQISRCGCLKWYLDDVQTEWTPNRTPCPCSNFQAAEDPRFVQSVDHRLKVNANRNGTYRTADISEWRHDTVPTGQCYQPRDGTGPRCCYFQRRSFWRNWWWGWWWFRGGLVWGPRGSRYERYQIPILDDDGLVDTRNEDVFNEQYNNALNGDLIPRRQCCIESASWRSCRLYRQRRPTATCRGYRWRGRVVNWGDPHFTTIDGASYTFNGLGEFHLVKADGIFSLQSRTARVEKSDGSLTDATAFVAFVAQDHRMTSGKVQFEVDYSDSSGTGVLVKVDGVLQTELSESEILVESVTLSVTNGSYKAVFPSLHSVSISASDFLLTVQFNGNPDYLQNVTKGLLGYWSGNKEDDFEFRDETVLNYENLKVTENLDILNGTLSERELYTFGVSWQVSESESLFTYDGGSDTYANHNPTNPPEPPFLEELVASQRNTDNFNTILNNCTTDGSISTTCLYDTLTTNNTQIGQTTLNVGAAFELTRAIGANTPPNATIDESSSSFVDGFFQVSLDTSSTLTVLAQDVDGDAVSFALADSNTVPNVTIDSASGVLTWLPMNQHLNLDPDSTSLVIIASDENQGESLLTIPIKLCGCPSANGACKFDSTMSGSDDYQIVNCECTEAWSGDTCTDDRNACASACYFGVSCTDRVAPEVGEDCGSCPAGTTGDGRNCTTINLCQSNPCQQECTSFFNGFNCSCMAGYIVSDNDNTLCDDIDECQINNPCDKIANSTCVNTNGSYRCECGNGLDLNINTCEDRNECTLGLHNCSQKTSTCQNEMGTFTCLCRTGYRQNNVNSTCENIDECAESTLNECAMNATCTDRDGDYSCTCQEGYVGDGKVCERAGPGSTCNGVECPEGETCDETTFACKPGSGSGSVMFERTGIQIILQLFFMCWIVFTIA